MFFKIMAKIKNIYFFKTLRNLFVVAGILFAIFIALAFTTLPFWGFHWLGTSKSGIKETPKTIVLLGGSGMPSESNLIRSWYAAQAARGFPGAKLIIAMPGDLSDSLSTPALMKKELELRGVKPGRISFENKGTNTRAQAINCTGLIKMQQPVLLVSSPEHMRRTVLCFEKAGFENVNALPAFENAPEADLTFKDDELGGNTLLAPDVGQSISVRYQIWNHLKYEIMIARELSALTYYKLRGWI